MKKSILLSLLFITVGFASVSTSLSLNGSVSVYNTLEDFDVYFSDVIVNDIQDWSPIEDEYNLVFSPNLFNGDYVLEYDITNSSKNYDADISVVCTTENEDIKVFNEFDNSTYLNANETITGRVTITDYYIGQEIVLGNEKFNVISSTDKTVSLLAQYNLGTDYKQTKTSNWVKFSDFNGWLYGAGLKEIDIQVWSSNPKIYVNEYVDYLQERTNDATITGNLITLNDLSELGCTIKSDYSWTDGLTCANSSNASWLVNGQNMWTRSAYSGNDYVGFVWSMQGSGLLKAYGYYNNLDGIRPVITISKDTLNNT